MHDQLMPKYVSFLFGYDQHTTNISIIPKAYMHMLFPLIHLDKSRWHSHNMTIPHMTNNTTIIPSISCKINRQMDWVNFCIVNN